MQVDVAPPPGERQLLLGGHRLVTEEDDLVVEQRGADLAQCLGVELARKIDAGDLGAERARDPAGLDPTMLRVLQVAHRPVLPGNGMMTPNRMD